MPNVSVDSSITTFRDQEWADEECAQAPSPAYLHMREMAERAAAKRSATPAARAIHQELAQMYSVRRRSDDARDD